MLLSREIKVFNTLINKWEELVFDFSTRIGLYPLVKDQIVIFPDFDLTAEQKTKQFILTMFYLKDM